MTRSILAASVCLGVASLAAYAEDHKDHKHDTKALAADAKDDHGHGMAKNSKEFAMVAAEHGLMEVQAGRLALKNASSDDVKQFGQRMITDHSKANDQLMALAKSKNMDLPTELKGKHNDTMKKLAAANGAEFDRMYMRHMVKDHAMDVMQFEAESKNGTDPDIKAFAATQLPILREHMTMAKALAAKVGVPAADLGDARTASDKVTGTGAGPEANDSRIGEGGSRNPEDRKNSSDKPVKNDGKVSGTGAGPEANDSRVGEGGNSKQERNAADRNTGDPSTPGKKE